MIRLPATWRLRIAKITPFTHQRWPCTIQPSWNSSSNILLLTIFFLIRNLIKSFLQNGDSEIPKISPFTHQRWPCTRQPSWYSSTTISFQTIYSLEQELEEGLPHNGFSEIANIIPFIHQTWPCTKQPSWNSSINTFFQTIYSLEQKIDGRLSAIWRLRNSKNHPIYTSKMAMHLIAILEFLNQHLLSNQLFSWAETWGRLLT